MIFIVKSLKIYLCKVNTLNTIITLINFFIIPRNGRAKVRAALTIMVYISLKIYLI